MTTPKLDMYSIKEVLRLKSEGRSHREIAQALGRSVGVVGKVSNRARHAGLDSRFSWGMNACSHPAEQSGLRTQGVPQQSRYAFLFRLCLKRGTRRDCVVAARSNARLAVSLGRITLDQVGVWIGLGARESGGAGLMG